MSRSADVVIVGGGVIGLSVAWELVRAGVGVVLLERGQVGGQATGAAAGMLAPLAEAAAPGPFVELGLASLRLYPAFVELLREATGIDAELVGPGMLRVAVNDTEEDALCAGFRWQKAAGFDVERLDGSAARKLEPELSREVCGAVFSPDERHVEPRRLARALALACVRRGARIVEGAPATSFDVEGARVTAVQSLSERFPCAQVVVAGGAWTAQIGEVLHAALPVFPIRGQILALACLPPPMRHTLYGHAGYLVPKADGRVVVGATEDRAGFDARPTASGMARLLSMAPRLVPALSEASFDTAWAGLRPASTDGLPILGPLPGWENVQVAAGHYRNGILLAPITGAIVAHSLQNATPHPLLEPFRADRFARDEDFRHERE